MELNELNVTTRDYFTITVHVRLEAKEIEEVSKTALKKINSEVVVEVPKEKYDEYKEMLYSHGLPETAKVVAY
ncbi:hypothetical protein SAMN02910358_01443 [Lachnospiraceae bacterium XBB1006]|nr:hypothetical protein SAMN02910358_01443 [Lachnospiraceae bacterium XBB1006]